MVGEDEGINIKIVFLVKCLVLTLMIIYNKKR